MKKIQSLFNGELEINRYRGKKILDGQHVNLSYGSVHSIWRRGLRNMDVSACRNILLLGLGGGSVISILRDDLGYTGKITAVELDPVIVKIAAREFGIRNAFNQKIIVADAFEYIAKTRLHYDLILCDLFIEHKVVTGVFQQDFWNKVAAILVPGGKIIVNVSTSGRQINRSRVLMERERERFRFYLIQKAGGSNTLLKGIKKMKAPNTLSGFNTGVNKQSPQTYK